MKDALKFTWYGLMTFIGIFGAVIWAYDIFQEHTHSLWVSIPFVIVSAYTGVYSYIKVVKIID